MSCKHYYLVWVRLEGAFPKCLFDELLVRVRGHELVGGDLEHLAVLVELVVLQNRTRHSGGFGVDSAEGGLCAVVNVSRPLSFREPVPSSRDRRFFYQTVTP